VGGIPLGVTGIYVGIVAVVFYSGGGKRERWDWGEDWELPRGTYLSGKVERNG